MKQVTPQGQGQFAERDFQAPAVETVGARLEQIGPFLQQNPVASQTSTPLAYGVPSGAGQPTNWLAGRAGSIFGLAVRMSATMPTGSAAFRPTVNGTPVGPSSAIAGQSVVAEFPSPPEFVAGDLLGVALTASALHPTNAAIQAQLLIRWSAD
jgi:hypothetical protein